MPDRTDTPGRPGGLARILNGIERAGNALPHPTLLFAWMALGVMVLSAITALLGVSAIHPVSGDTINAVNLISGDGIRRILAETVDNFTGFAPLGTVLVTMLGIGIAERSGLIDVLLRRLVLAAPQRSLTFCVVLAGVLSSLAADSGYVVLIPLAALVFRAAGRHPIAGIAAAFAGVSAGYSANLLIGPLDAILAGLSTEAVALIDPDYEVNAAGNWWFIVASTLLISLVVTAVTELITEPRLQPSEPGVASDITVRADDAADVAADARAVANTDATALALADAVAFAGALAGADAAALALALTAADASAYGGANATALAEPDARGLFFGRDVLPTPAIHGHVLTGSLKAGETS